MGKKVYQDRHGNCSECQAPFKITIREQIFLETLGYRFPKKCAPCRRKSKKEKSTGERLGSSIRSMFEAGEFEKLFEPRDDISTSATIPEIKPVLTSEDTTPKTPKENVAELKMFFGIIPILPEQPEASLEDIKAMMTRAGEMRWPDDGHKCRKQGCSANGHIHPYFKGAEAKSMIRSLYGVESSKELRKPQVEFLYVEFGKVLAGRAFLDRDGQGTVYIATPAGTTEEEVKRNVLAYAK